jgi:hypothetical protein
MSAKIAEDHRDDAKLPLTRDHERARTSRTGDGPIDEFLDQALEDTFPASDPIAIGR